MAIHYIKSTNILELTDQLWEKIFLEKQKNPLIAPKVIVPNKNMRKWLNLHLAERKGLVSHIDFSFLEKTLEEYFTLRAKNRWNPGESSFPSQSEIQKQILEYMIRNRDSHDLSKLKTFLSRPSKLFGFSRKLALLFRDYEVNRREWIQAWFKEKYPTSSEQNYPQPDTSLENNAYYIIQKKIYSDLFLPSPESPEPKTLTQWLYQETGLLNFGGGGIPSSKNSSDNSNSKPFDSIHLFCLSQLGYGFLEILDSLAKKDGLDLYFYQFHSKTEPESSEDSPFHKWQKPQNMIENYWKDKSIPTTPPIENESDWERPVGLQTLLKILDSPANQDVLDLSDGKHGSKDGSVRFWNAPSAYREVEAVFQDILHKLYKDKTLTYEDFAILVTDMPTYKPAIQWAFDGGCMIDLEETPDSPKKDLSSVKDNNPISDPKFPNRRIERLKIPYSLTDINAGESSYLYAAIQELWKICKRDRIDLQSVKSLIANPQVFNHLDKDTKNQLIETLDTLQVKYEEWNRGNDSFLISQGIQRVRLSSILTPEKSMEMSGIPTMDNADESLALILTELWEEILSTREQLTNLLSRGVWSKDNLEKLGEIMEGFFRLTDTDEYYLFQKWKENLLLWEDLDLGNKNHPAGNRNKKSNIKRDTFELLSHITSDTFQAIPFQVGSYLTYGVNVSLLQPMRPIPFRHIYILGLGEGKFPGRTDRSELNLQNQNPKKDRDTNRREIQEALFWETLHSAQSSLTLSYVGKDLKTDKTYEPCSTLSNLLNRLEIPRALEIPMHAYSALYPSGQDSPMIEMGLVSYDYSRVWKNKDYNNKLLVLSNFTNSEELDVSSNEKLKKNKIFLRDLIRHFRDPLADYMNRNLQVYKTQEDENLDESDYESFHLTDLQKAIYIRDFYPILAEDLTLSNHSSQDEWQESWTEERIRTELKRLFAPRIKSASFPQEVFSEVEIQSFTNSVQCILKIWGENLWGRVEEFTPHLILGETGLRKNNTLHLIDGRGEKNRLVLDLEGRQVEILHEWENCFRIMKNHWVWIYPKSLKNDVSFGSYNGYQSDYWDSHSQLFFSLLVAKALGIHFTVLNHKSLPTPDSMKTEIFGDPIDDFSMEVNEFHLTKADAICYLKDIIQSLESEDLPLFSPMNFLRFASENMDNKNKSSDEFWELDDKIFRDFLVSDADISLGLLPDPVYLYSKIESLLGKLSMDFARRFYKPLIGLYAKDRVSPSEGKNSNPNKPTPKKSKPKKTASKKKTKGK